MSTPAPSPAVSAPAPSCWGLRSRDGLLLRLDATPNNRVLTPDARYAKEFATPEYAARWQAEANRHASRPAAALEPCRLGGGR